VCVCESVISSGDGNETAVCGGRAETPPPQLINFMLDGFGESTKI